MRRLIFLLLTITLIVISFLTIKQFEFNQFQLFNESDESDEIWEINISEGNPHKNKTENFRLLSDISNELNVNIQRISYERDSESNTKVVYYVALGDPELYFEKLKLIDGSYLTADSNSEEFLSTIKYNSTHQIGQLELFRSFDPIEIRPIMSAIKKKDIKGVYSLSGEINKDRFEELAISYGFSLGGSEKKTQKLLADYPYQDIIYKSTIILFLLIGLATFYDLINNYKAIAVRQLFGFSFFDITKYLLLRYLPLLVGSILTVSCLLIVFLHFYNNHNQLFEYIVFLSENIMIFIYANLIIFVLAILGTFTINISQMIKNKKPMKLVFILNLSVRFILSIFLLLGLYEGLNTYLELKNTTSQEERWDSLNNYFFLGIVAESDEEIINLLDDEEKNNNFINFYKELESSGSVYISPSAFYLNDKDDYLLELDQWGYDGMRIELNRNYLDINPIYDQNNTLIKLPEPTENELVVLIPEKYANVEDEIIQSLKADYVYAYPNYKDVNIIVKYVRDNQNYFSYSTHFAEDENYLIEDPIAVVVNPNFDTSFLLTNISMGYGYYIKNSSFENPYSSVEKLLEDYDLNEIWQPISTAYSNVELKIANDKELLHLTILTCVLYSFLALVILVFSIMYYLEMNRQLLSVQRIFGYSYFEKHGVVYLFVLVFWSMITFICSYFVLKTLFLAKVSLILLLVDILLISLTIKFKEYKVVMKKID